MQYVCLGVRVCLRCDCSTNCRCHNWMGVPVYTQQEHNACRKVSRARIYRGVCDTSGRGAVKFARQRLSRPKPEGRTRMWGVLRKLHATIFSAFCCLHHCVRSHDFAQCCVCACSPHEFAWHSIFTTVSLACLGACASSSPHIMKACLSRTYGVPHTQGPTFVKQVFPCKTALTCIFL